MPSAPHSTGYSGTPLAKKLGIKAAGRVVTIDAPVGYKALLAPLPDAVTFGRSVTQDTDIVHLFATDRTVLASQLATLRSAVRADAMVWVSWPKKTAKVATTITEDVIREVALPMGFVDVKVCAVSEIWSGLKLVVRKELR